MHPHQAQLRRHDRAAGEFADGGDARAHRQGAGIEPARLFDEKAAGRKEE
jgi:hypothetical protein